MVLIATVVRDWTCMSSWHSCAVGKCNVSHYKERTEGLDSQNYLSISSALNQLSTRYLTITFGRFWGVTLLATQKYSRVGNSTSFHGLQLRIWVFCLSLQQQLSGSLCQLICQLPPALLSSCLPPRACALTHASASSTTKHLLFSPWELRSSSALGEPGASCGRQGGVAWWGTEDRGTVAASFSR